MSLFHRKYLSFILFRRMFANWPSVIMDYVFGKDLIKVMFKNRSMYYLRRKDIPKIVWLSHVTEVDPNYISVDENYNIYYSQRKLNTRSFFSTLLSYYGAIEDSGIWYLPKLNLKFLGANFSLVETFFTRTYDYAEVNDREVVDIGANIGDTAIYFAVNGAKKVVALEPIPSVAKIAEQNVKINALQDKIIVLNAALGSKRGKIAVPSKIDVEKSSGFSINGKGDTLIDVLSMEDVRRMVKDPFLLKMDCEGCEVDIILNSELDFDNLIIEQHYFLTKVPGKKLIERLKGQGYECKEGPLPFSRSIKKTESIIYCKKRL